MPMKARGNSYLVVDSGEALEPRGRDEWRDSLHFFFTVLGFCVGLGNIWRFPYLCQENGGGAFVIPFLIMLVVEGMPLLLLELAIGQKFRKGSYMVWNQIHPWLGGIGLGSTVIAIVVGCYYNIIIAWCFYYLFKSITTHLPWTDCPTLESVHNDSLLYMECQKSSETQYFWYRETLDITESIEEPGGLRWWMLLSLAIAWVVVYLIIMKGIQSSGKVVYFTALFPYVILSIFFVRGITLKGAGAGLAHMFYPDLDKLSLPKVWLDAANQVFYSYGLAFGSIISFGSYNPEKKNCVLDTYILSACNAFTAVYACAVVFSILGFKAQLLFEKCIQDNLADMSRLGLFSASEMASADPSEFYQELLSSLEPAAISSLRNCSLEVELNKAAQGTGLAFIVMTDVFTKLPGAPFWSFLFFAMLLSLGLGSQIGILEGVLGTLFDMPQLKKFSRPFLSGAGCFFCFSIGVVFTIGSGEYWLTLFDDYGAMGLTLIALAEILTVVTVYGHRRFTQDIHEMTGVRPGLYWQIAWRLLAPGVIIILLIWTIVSELQSSPTYSAWDRESGESVELVYPTWSRTFAVILALASVAPIVIIGLLRACKVKILEVGDPDLPMKRVETNASTNLMLNKSYCDIPTDEQQD